MLTHAEQLFAEQLFADIKAAVIKRVSVDGKISTTLFEREQKATHGFAWAATAIETIRQLEVYQIRMTAEGRFGELESLLVEIGQKETLNQLLYGLPMSQNETVRLSDFGLAVPHVPFDLGITPEKRVRVMDLMLELGDATSFGDTGLDETLSEMREEMRKFTLKEVTPFAHQWHLKNDYIPLELIAKLADMGVFGLTVPEEFGGMALGKTSMCVVSEELSRGYIGVGSLGTRSEIACELIMAGGTEAQKAKWLPVIASGECLPTAVFTEPNTGSDLASLKTRAVLADGVYKVTGNKTWITHPVRADVMTLLVRTNPAVTDHNGLSLLLAQKPRGDDANPFPAVGMTGGEIEVLGYRGMKEYEIGFDGFEVSRENLLGGVEGQGFRQLMQTFEAARIQTAARAIGVAQNALDLALAYAKDRVQFGKALVHYPRISDKIVMMAVEIMAVRQLTYFAAREKDNDRRCDIEAGMAKLLGARVAWSSADNALQIHGGNGFALEYPISRVLCDARILNIFEGAAEIQAQVVARRLLQPA